MEKRYEYHDKYMSNRIPVIYHYDITDTRPSLCNWHGNVEILHIVKGASKAILGGEYYDVSAGDTVIVNANVPHTVMPGVEYHCIIPDAKFLKDCGIDTASASFKCVVRDTTLSSLCEELAGNYRSDSEYRELKIKSAILSLMVYIAENFLTKNLLFSRKSDEEIECVTLTISYIEGHFSDKITLEDMASVARLSKFYFTRKFKEITGMTPFEYLVAVRISNAKKELSASRSSVRDAARNSGFFNDSYFSKVFKQQVGILPIEFLKKQNSVKETQ